jgi:hypothetical protein
LGKTVTNRNDIHDEIKMRVNLKDACYHLGQNILFSCVIPETEILE